jgi:DNA-binding winged helix-turn-helix (wHTH) protein
LEHAGEMVSRDELHQKLWPADTFVDFDHGLNNAINRLREALSDSAEKPLFIETLPRRGYRFIAPISQQVPTKLDALGTSEGKWTGEGAQTTEGTALRPTIHRMRTPFRIIGFRSWQESHGEDLGWQLCSLWRWESHGLRGTGLPFSKTQRIFRKFGR